MENDKGELVDLYVFTNFDMRSQSLRWKVLKMDSNL